MNRRKAIKNLGLISGGLLVFSSCDLSDDKVSVIIKRLQITTEQKNLVDTLVSTIIPEGKIPGAKSLNITNFVWTMVYDCMSDVKRNSYTSGLKLFTIKVNGLNQKPFTELNEEKKSSILTDLIDKGLNEEKKINDIDSRDIKNFINTSIYYTILGYKQSEYMMKEIMPYQLVPGTYGLCETIDKTKKINVNA